jgi:cbb3-type cytochrome oxidase cytochrome c subunit
MTTLRREMRRLLVVVTLAIVIFSAAIVVTLLLVDAQVKQIKSNTTLACIEVEGLKVAIRMKLNRSDDPQERKTVTLFEEQPCPRR